MEVVEIERYLNTSEKVLVDDLDWELARRAGLTEREVFILSYFADIEGQTIVYMRDFLHTKTALEPEVIAFLSMWNYEEYFHGRALSSLLDKCGHGRSADQIARVRSSAQLSEKIEAFFSTLLSRVFSDQFPALYMAWGAIQELTTLRGYEQIARTTQNPVLKTLVERIAKQERRHFAWYFNSAEARLGASPGARRLTRLLMERFWSPVGAGVKPDAEVARLMRTLFPGDAGPELAHAVDSKMSTLPGLGELRLMHGFLRSPSVAEPVAWAQPVIRHAVGPPIGVKG